jgi:regulatory protein
MSVITKITVQQKQKDRYNIFIDDGNGEKYAFSVDEDVLIKQNLKKGMEIDEFAITEILFHDDIRKAYNQAVQYLAIRMRSEFEVRQYLQKKEIDESIVNEVIHKLYKFKFLNDQEFALAYVRTQMNTSDKGSVIIQQELKEKGIKVELIENALLEYPILLQQENAEKLAKKFFQKNNKDSSKVMKQKLEQMLIRKGYPFEIIQETIESLDLSKDLEDEMEALRKQGEKLRVKYGKHTGYEFLQKLKQSLYRKGFSIELINQYLSEIQEMDEA